MALEKQIHSGTRSSQPSKREYEHGILAREMAAEGMVLLKNEELLPLDRSMSIGLFGGGAVQTVKGGIGSGDVNNRRNVSIFQGLKDAEAVITSAAWLADYEERYRKARETWKEKVLADAAQVENPFDAYANNPFSLPDGREITKKDLSNAAVAVYVISRIAGEGKDRRKEKGDYYLSQKEEEDLLFLNQMNIPIVLILNVGAPVELTALLQQAPQIRAVLHICLPGQEGGHAVADVLFGHAAPGGRLTATWARHYEDYPSSENFGYLNGDLTQEEYKEGIYVGYRYFDNYKISPLFPFGYGLSYTTFSVKVEGFQRTASGVEITVSVKNDGEVYAGREVVQVYATLPQTDMSKEHCRLVGFAKTQVLAPQSVQKLTIFVRTEAFGSYAKWLHAWVMEAGTYGIWIGEHVNALQSVQVFDIQETIVLEQIDKKDVQPQDSWIQMTAEWSVEELVPLLYGNITQGTSTLGSSGVRVPGSAGETTEALETSGVRSLIMADGPAGLRLRQSYEVDRRTDTVYGVGVLGSLENGYLETIEEHENADKYYQFCTAFPVGTALAQTWDVELLRKFGEAIAVEMEEFHVDLWLAPGMNIQRNPLCGRNFEYYSEDPLLSGLLAAAVTDGVQSHSGCGVTIKHFACNHQEDNRMGVDVHVDERTLREIYLRGFEIVVKMSRPVAIMSSYNRINGVHAANNYQLCTSIARDEWGFEGVIMSDWNTTVPEDGSIPWQCVSAGNDLIMPGNPEDAEDIQKAYERGELLEEQIRVCAGRILAMIQKLT